MPIESLTGIEIFWEPAATLSRGSSCARRSDSEQRRSLPRSM